MSTYTEQHIKPMRVDYKATKAGGLGNMGTENWVIDHFELVKQIPKEMFVKSPESVVHGMRIEACRLLANHLFELGYAKVESNFNVLTSNYDVGTRVKFLRPEEKG